MNWATRSFQQSDAFIQVGANGKSTQFVRSRQHSDSIEFTDIPTAYLYFGNKYHFTFVDIVYLADSSEVL
ncbi:hypothetical protein [Paraburkholderia phenazinium]|uniref:hypothetical protein n=1 Tax=Paraburkholderia phenazinium TaxID=60549 RepID=UPI001181036A|nr:hypothetical protein [Paraburkholderia phenazinium]